MVCEVCKQDAPYSRAHWQRRMAELDRNPTIDIYPCPECGGTDYMLSEVNIDQDPPRGYAGILSTTPSPRLRLAKELPLPQPPRSLWARLLDWWNTRRSLWN